MVIAQLATNNMKCPSGINFLGNDVYIHISTQGENIGNKIWCDGTNNKRPSLLAGTKTSKLSLNNQIMKFIA